MPRPFQPTLRLPVLILSLGLALTSPLFAADDSPITPIQIPGVGNFAQVAPGLYRGAQPTAEGFRELEQRGIKTVVNLRTFHSDRRLLEGTHLRYINIKAQAWNPSDSDAAEFLKVLEDPANLPVFVHCQHGSDRTGYIVAAYRIDIQQWSADQAMGEMARFGLHPIWFMIPRYVEHYPTRTNNKHTD